MSDLDDNFDDNFDEEDQDAKRADESEESEKKKCNTLEKRLIIDNLLAEKRLAKALGDDFDDFDDLDDDWDEDE